MSSKQGDMGKHEYILAATNVDKQKSCYEKIQLLVQRMHKTKILNELRKGTNSCQKPWKQMKYTH